MERPREGSPSRSRTTSRCRSAGSGSAKASTIWCSSPRPSTLMASSKISGDVTDADYMTRALFHAARGRGRTSPNPVVGAVIVSADGVVVGEGFHARAGAPHAEINALDMAGARAGGATLYCSLEPCCHTGRTGPCAARIAEAGITRVVAAVQDPNPLVRGRGFEFLRSRGITV